MATQRLTVHSKRCSAACGTNGGTISLCHSPLESLQVIVNDKRLPFDVVDELGVCPIGDQHIMGVGHDRYISFVLSPENYPKTTGRGPSMVSTLSHRTVGLISS